MRFRTISVRWLVALIAGVALAGSIAGFAWTRPPSGPHHEIEMSALAPDVAARYEFAHTHIDLMKQLPCYCGCGGALGHRSLLDCYLTRRGGYASHAADCQVCRDEAEDAERLLAAGESTQAIRAFIDARYSEMGPSTKTP